MPKIKFFSNHVSRLYAMSYKSFSKLYFLCFQYMPECAKYYKSKHYERVMNTNFIRRKNETNHRRYFETS